MKIFKQAVKKIESSIRSFLILSVLFLAVGVIYGAEYPASDWDSFSAAYNNSNATDINVSENILFTSWLNSNPSWTRLTIHGRSKILNDNYRRGFFINQSSTQELELNNLIYKKGRRGGWYSNENNTEAYGGAVEVRNGARLILSGNVTFEDNEIVKKQGSDSAGTYRKAYGGAIGLYNRGLLTIAHSTVSFLSNVAEDKAGAVYLHSSRMDIENSNVDFRWNYSDMAGALNLSYSTTVVTNSILNFIGNSATGGNSGAIEAEDYSLLEIKDHSVVNFFNNTAAYGGALRAGRFSIVIIEDAHFIGNRAESGGAVIVQENYDFTIRAANRNVVFSNNKASDLANDILMIKNSLITFDAASYSIDLQGGISADDGRMTDEEKKRLRITKKGYGSLSLSGRNYLRGTLDIQQGGVYIASGELFDVSLTSLSVRRESEYQYATYSTVDDKTGQTTAAEKAYLYGSLSLDVDFTGAGASDKISATYVDLGEYTAISINNVGGYDLEKTSITVVTSENPIIGSPDADYNWGHSDTDYLFNARYAVGIKDGNKLVVYLKEAEPINSASDITNASSGTFLKFADNLTANSIEINRGIVINGNQKTLKGAPNKTGFDIEAISPESSYSQLQVEIIDLNFSGFTGDDGIAVRVSASGLGFYAYASVNIAANKNDVVFSGNTTDLKLEDNAYVTVSGNKNVIFNGKVEGTRGSSLSKTGKGTMEFKGDVNLLGRLNVGQGYVRHASNKTVNVSTLNISGGTFELGNNARINVKADLDIYGGALEIGNGGQVIVDKVLKIRSGALEIGNGGHITASNLNILGGAIKIGKNSGYITATNLTLSYSATDNSWLSISEDMVEGDKKGIIEVPLANLVGFSASSITMISSDALYETTLWVYDWTAPGSGFNGTNPRAAGDFTGIWVEVLKRDSLLPENGWYSASVGGGISLSGAFIANALRENAKANTGAIYSNFDQTVWVSANFDGASVSDDENFGASGFGAQAGYKFYDSASAKVGVFAGFGSKNFKQGSDKGSMSEFGFGVYGGYFSSSFGLKGFAGLGIQSNELKNGGTKAEFDSTAIRFGAEAEFGAGLIKPFAGFEAGLVSNPDIDVKVDGDTAATIDANSFMRFALLGGVKLANKQDRLSYFGKGYLGFLLAGGKPEYDSSMKISDTHSVSRTIDGSEQQAVYLGLGAGIDYAISSAVSLFANIDTKVNADIFDYQGNVGASFKF